MNTYWFFAAVYLLTTLLLLHGFFWPTKAKLQDPKYIPLGWNSNAAWLMGLIVLWPITGLIFLWVSYRNRYKDPL